MEKYFLFFIVLFLIVLEFGNVSAAHFIIGRIEDAVDGTSANGHVVMLWNPVYGKSDNLIDVIGESGNSGVNDTYMIDCESLLNGCNVNDNLSIEVVNTGDDYNSENVSVTVTGAGFDIAPNITLNAPPNISSIVVDDSILIPANQIDLITASTRKVYCKAIVKDPEGGLLYNLSARFFDVNSSFYDDLDDNNYHYTNSSCVVNSSYVSVDNESQVVCGFDTWYYANQGSWNCTLNVQDNLSARSETYDSIIINPLLSVGVNSNIDFGILNTFNVSKEIEVNVTNYGNVKINLSLYGYATNIGDGYAMNCTLGNEISLYYERYNLTSSNLGNLDLSGMESLYKNLSSDYTVETFNLNPRQDDLVNNAVNFTYWRIYVPPGTGGECVGNIVFGASTSQAG